MKKSLTVIAVIAMLCSAKVFAGGFQINEHGARAMSMAGAFTALANDPSAIYYNPAGLTQLTGTHFMAGVTLIAPSAKFTGPKPSTKEYEMESQVFNPFNFYATQQLSEDWFVGIGVNNQYGLGTKWDNNWAGRYLAVDTEIRSFYFTPVVAYKFSEQFSASVGLTYAYADVKIIRNTPLADPVTGQQRPDGQVTLKGDGTAIGFTAGILYKPTKEFSLGLSYRSESKFDFEGDASTSPATLDFVHPLAGKQSIPLPNGSIKAPLTTPQNLTLGLGYIASEALTLSADFQYIGWSSYDKLEVTFEKYDLAPTVPGVQNVQSANRMYENTFILRAGAEYKVSNEFTLRGGLLYDNNPVQDEYVEPTLPDADRIGFNIGFGYKFTENLSVDVAYLLLTFAEREITNSKFGLNGTYQNMAHLFGIDFSYSL
ncbi:MAG: outer membrane protein transport protein [Melioribacteraceae bacterium]